MCPHFLWRRWLRYVVEGFCSFRFCATVFFFCLFVFQWSTLGNVKMVVLVNGTPEIPWVFFSITSKLFVKVRLGSSISRRAYILRLPGFWIFSRPLYSATGYLVVWGRVSLDSWDPLMKGIENTWDFTPIRAIPNYQRWTQTTSFYH